MPDNLSVERRQSMTRVRRRARPRRRRSRRHGRRARPRRDRCAREGKGTHARPVRESRQSARALPRHRARSCGARPTGAITHFVSAMGTTGTIMGVSRFLKEKNPPIADRRRAAGGRRVDSGHPQVAGSVPAEDLRRARASTASSRSTQQEAEDDDAPARGARRASSAASRRAARARSRCASRARCANATIVFVVCDRGDRYLSTGVFRRGSVAMARRSRRDADPRLRHRDGARRRGHPARARAVRADAPTTTLMADGTRSSAARRTGSDFAPHYLQKVVAIAARCASATASRSCRSASSAIREPELIRRFFEGIEKLHAAARVVERQRLRPAGAALPRDDPRRHRGALLGLGRRRPDFKFNNYLARYHTRHLDLMDVLALFQPRAQRGARRDGAAVRLPGQARHGRQRGRRGGRPRRARRRAQLLRDRRRQHLPPLPALPADARRARPPASTRRRSRSCARRIAATDAPHWKAFVAAWDAA